MQLIRESTETMYTIKLSKTELNSIVIGLTLGNYIDFEKQAKSRGVDDEVLNANEFDEFFEALEKLACL